MKYLGYIKEFLLILLGSILYGASTVLFIFPNSLFLGGTTGISVILTSFADLSPGTISMIINFSLIVLAFIVLGKGMAIKTFIGSLLTTVFIGLFEVLFKLEAPLIPNPYISAAAGATVIAIASGIMFYVDSSSGGTDIIALIVQKFFTMQIGRALLITDIMIVIVGGILSDVTVLFASLIGLIIKTFGIDFVISIMRKIKIRSIIKNKKEEKCI